MIRKVNLIVLTVFSFCSLLSFSHAQEQSGEVIYSESGNTQANSIFLNTYEDKLKYWQSLSDEQRQAIRERAQKITPEQMQALRGKLAKFRKLSPGQAKRIKTNYERFKQMSPEKRNDLKQRFNRFQQLPEEKKIELRRKFIEIRFRRSLLNERRNNIQQPVKFGDKEGVSKDNATPGISNGKTEVYDLKNDRKQNRRDIIKKRLENRKRFINRRRSLLR